MKITEGIVRLYAEDTGGHAILSLKAHITEQELLRIQSTLKKLSLSGFLRSYQAGWLRGEPIPGRLMPEGASVLRYVEALEDSFFGPARMSSLGARLGGPQDSYPEDWDPRPYEWDVLRDKIARTLFALAWAGALDERGYCIGPVSVLDAAPETPARVKRVAAKFLSELARLNGKSVSGILKEAARLTGVPDAGLDAIADIFGYYLAMEALGHGVSWEDDYPPHGLEVPYVEFSSADLDEAELDLGNWSRRNE